MKVFRRAEAFRRWCRGRRSLGLVPTMGALHEGHLSLARRSKKECSATAVTLFVNPTQFGPTEDFAAYPRSQARDFRLLRKERVDAVFAPPVREVYPHGFATLVRVDSALTKVLEGARRPGHFDGVATVVAKLFVLAGAHKAFFGLKDYQQFLVVSRLASDLGVGTKVVGCPIVREKDGLAMSSRNAYLSAEQRKAAPAFAAAVKAASDALRGKESPARARRIGLERLRKEKRFRLDYLQVADAKTLGKPSRGNAKIVLAAAWIGKTRLIDNRLVKA